MSRAALMHDADAAESSLARSSSSVRVSHPGDSFEMEAERVADTVSRGGRVSGWSLSASGFDGVYRQPDPPTPPITSPGDIAGKVAEAILATPEGKKALDKVTSAVTSPAGLVITGATAVGVVAAMDKAKRPLPLQAPAIPLDFIKPGLSVKITYSGPVNQPTGGSITFSFSPKAADKKPAQSATDKQRAENADLAADQEKFRAGLQTSSGPGPVKSAEDRMFEKWQMDKLAAIGNLGKSKVTEPATGAASAPPAAAAPAVTPAPAEKKLEPAPAAAPTPKVEEKKKEEHPVQRKAEPSGPMTTGSADVDSVLRSPGRPLDRATRREMESRIGFDFSNVRLHTDSHAADSARSLSAQAYTVGSNVVFAPGRFAPHTTEGRRLLAHELTHVVQQTTSPQRAHPAVRPAPQHVQRSWWDDLGAFVDKEKEEAKQWLLRKLRELPGYDLFCMMIQRDLITGERVERSAEKLVSGVLNLIPGGQEVYNKLKGAKEAVDKALKWLITRAGELKLTAEDFSKLLTDALNAVSIRDLGGSWERLKKLFNEPLKNLMTLAGEIATKVLDLIVEGIFSRFPAGRKIWPILQKAGAALSKIAADPLTFGKTLVAALKQGFQRFYDNIGANLLNGLQRFVFEEIKMPDLKPPEGFNPSSLFKFALNLLKISYPSIRAKLVKKLAPIGGETVVHYAEKAVDFIQAVRAGGLTAIWEMIKDKLDSIGSAIFDSIKSWAIGKIVKLGLEKIIALSNPVGEIIEVIKDTVEIFEFFLEKAEQMINFFESVVDSFAKIAEGDTNGAAGFIEATIKRSIPLILRFLASILGLGDFGEGIRDAIQGVIDKVDAAIDKGLTFLVDKITPIWNDVKAFVLGKLAAAKEWWLKPRKFHYGEDEHDIVVKGTGQKPEVFVHSAEEKPVDAFLAEANATPAQKKQIHDTVKGLTHKEADKQTPEENEAGANKLDQLGDQMGKLKPQAIPPVPAIDNPGTNALGGGISATAFLRKGLGTGTGTAGAKDVPIIADLGVLRANNEKKYVKGHLLSQKLGGVGEWKNLMPITNTVNGRMNAWVETPLKNAAPKLGGNRAYWYKVDAGYDLAVDINKIDPTSNKPPERQKAELAEKRLVSLSWKTRMATWTKEQGWQPNEDQLVDEKGTPIAEAKPKKLREDSFDPTER